MLIKTQNFNSVSCDRLGLPRFWCFAWTNTKLASLAQSTRIRRLNDVDKLYNYVDEIYQLGALDDALARVDVDILADIFFGYFHHIQLHAPHGSDPSSLVFKHAYDFVIETCQLIKPTVDFKEVDQKIRPLENIYGSLRFNQKTGVVQIRVLPTGVLETSTYCFPCPDDKSRCSHGGMKKMREFYETYRIIRNQLVNTGALSEGILKNMISGKD